MIKLTFFLNLGIFSSLSLKTLDWFLVEYNYFVLVNIKFKISISKNDLKKKKKNESTKKRGGKKKRMKGEKKMNC